LSKLITDYIQNCVYRY